MKNVFLQNAIKNIIVVIILIFSWQPLHNFLIGVDNSAAGNILLAVSILAVAAFFGCFTFTYEKTKDDNYWLFWAHLTTGLLTLVVGWSLQMTVLLVEKLSSPFIFFRFTSIIFYISLVLYDFWDLKRMKINE